MDINIQGIVILIIMEYDTNRDISEAKCVIRHKNSAHPDTSPIDCEGVQPYQCQTSLTHVCVYHKEA